MAEEVTPPAKPAEATPPPAPKEVDSVTLPKAEVDQLRRDAARAAEAQATADRLKKSQARSKTHFDPARKPAPPSEDEVEAQGRAEDAKAERGLIRLAADPEFREVLDADPTLRDLLITDPLSVVRIHASDAFDAEDAIGRIKEVLAAKKAAIKKPDPTPDPKKPADNPTPPAGGVNPQGGAPGHSEEYEAAKKNPNTESAVAGMVGAKLRERMNKK